MFHPAGQVAQYSLLLVPEGEGDVQASMGVRYASNAVLAPAKRSAACHVVGEVTPGISIFSARHNQQCSCSGRTCLRVVLSDSGPLPLSNIRTPTLPILAPLAVLFETLLFLADNLVLVDEHHLGKETRPIWKISRVAKRMGQRRAPVLPSEEDGVDENRRLSPRETLQCKNTVQWGNQRNTAVK